MDFKTVEDYILTLEDVLIDNTLNNSLTAYKLKTNDSEQLFALLKNSEPVQVSLKCDHQLTALLREKYETVMPGRNLNPVNWNTILLTGQLSWDDIKGLIILSYNLVKNQN